MDRVEEFLQHYASEFYDPTKAHDYYIKNRQLTGRTTSKMSTIQKEAWAYSKDAIKNKKNLEVTTNQNTEVKSIDQLRAEMSKTRERISSKLKLLNDAITAKTDQQNKVIQDKRKAEIDSLPPIPKKISAASRAILVEQRSKEISSINDGAKDDKLAVSGDSKKQRTANSADTASNRGAIQASLKDAIGNIRTQYKAAKVKLDADYESKYQTEYNNIIKNIAGNAPKAKRK